MTALRRFQGHGPSCAAFCRVIEFAEAAWIDRHIAPHP